MTLLHDTLRCKNHFGHANHSTSPKIRVALVAFTFCEKEFFIPFHSLVHVDWAAAVTYGLWDCLLCRHNFSIRQDKRESPARDGCSQPLGHVPQRYGTARCDFSMTCRNSCQTRYCCAPSDHGANTVPSRAWIDWDNKRACAPGIAPSAKVTPCWRRY